MAKVLPCCQGAEVILLFPPPSKVTFLRVNMLAERETDDYCGVFYNDPASEERSVAIAIRTHRTLELVGDKFYMITCGKAGFQNSRSVSHLVEDVRM